MKMIKDETSAVTVKETRMDFYQATPPEKCKLHKFGVLKSRSAVREAMTKKEKLMANW